MKRLAHLIMFNRKQTSFAICSMVVIITALGFGQSAFAVGAVTGVAVSGHAVGNTSQYASATISYTCDIPDLGSVRVDVHNSNNNQDRKSVV